MQQNVGCVLCRQKTADLEATVARLTKQIERLARQCNTDPLTRLANRRHIGEVMAGAHRRVRNGQEDSVAALIIDADHFKNVNDTYGHQVGDDVLIAIAKTLSSPLLHVRAVGRGRGSTATQTAEEKRQLRAGRWGGEEFVAVAVNVDNPRALAERICAAVRKIRIPGYPDLRVTVSIGVAQATVHAYVTKEELLRRADRAMYEAKQSGRDRVVMAEMPMSDTRQLLVV